MPGVPLGEVITPGGRYLLAADGDGAVVISVARAEHGWPGAVAGMLAAPSGGESGAGGAIEAAVSPDGRFAFVTVERAQQAAVFNLGKALRRGFGRAGYVGAVPLGLAPVGVTVSPGGRWLYATSEISSAAGLQSAWAAAGSRRGPARPPGTLTVIDLRRAETNPATSVVATVDAGCQPVRVTTSADGSAVWVTARASGDLLCFSAARLLSDPAHALVAAVQVGEAPVGLATVRGGALVVVADSNRFGATAARSNLDVVSVASGGTGNRSGAA